MADNRDDEVVEAEIVTDVEITVSPQPEATVMRFYPNPGPVENAIVNGPKTSHGVCPIAVPLNDYQRAIVREALAHYCDHGPRNRHTAGILAVLQHVAAYDAKFVCAMCRDSGSYRTMYREEFCSCTAGVLKRKGVKRS